MLTINVDRRTMSGRSCHRRANLRVHYQDILGHRIRLSVSPSVRPGITWERLDEF